LQDCVVRRNREATEVAIVRAKKKARGFPGSRIDVASLIGAWSRTEYPWELLCSAIVSPPGGASSAFTTSSRPRSRTASALPIRSAAQSGFNRRRLASAPTRENIRLGSSSPPSITTFRIWLSMIYAMPGCARI
jgi:hypothetical protein